MKLIDLLKSEIEEAAFMLVDDANRKEIHAKLVGCLVILGQLRESDVPAEGHIAISDQSTTSQMEEVSKVRRRLEMWAKPGRQSQYNSRILKAFLELRREVRVAFQRVTLFPSWEQMIGFSRILCK
jgi:hypothetical protein